MLIGLKDPLVDIFPCGVKYLLLTQEDTSIYSFCTVV
jgi:hypothetical protein